MRYGKQGRKMQRGRDCGPEGRKGRRLRRRNCNPGQRGFSKEIYGSGRRGCDEEFGPGIRRKEWECTQDPKSFTPISTKERLEKIKARLETKLDRVNDALEELEAKEKEIIKEQDGEEESGSL